MVSERLGDSTINITLDTYSHVMPDMQDEAAGKLDGVLKAAMRAASRHQSRNGMSPNRRQSGEEGRALGSAKAPQTLQSPCKMAEGVGFEPTNDLRRCRFSRPVR